MKPFISILAAAAALILQACSSTNVTTDYDRQADFTKYKSFGWMPVPDRTTMNPLLRNSLTRKHVENAVSQTLAAKGMEANATSPDVLVAYHLGVKEKIDVTSWGYGYGRWGAWGGSNVDVRQYKEGTMVIDLIDASTKELVWRGVGRGAVGSGDPETKIREAVDEILSHYPPGTHQ